MHAVLLMSLGVGYIIEDGLCQIYLLKNGLEAKHDGYVQFSLCLRALSGIQRTLCASIFPKIWLRAKQFWKYAILIAEDIVRIRPTVTELSVKKHSPIINANP